MHISSSGFARALAGLVQSGGHFGSGSFIDLDISANVPFETQFCFPSKQQWWNFLYFGFLGMGSVIQTNAINRYSIIGQRCQKLIDILLAS
jgi:hypothetical protein